MTVYILIALMYAQGQLQARIIEMPSAEACGMAAQAVMQSYKGSTAICVGVQSEAS